MTLFWMGFACGFLGGLLSWCREAIMTEAHAA